MTAVDKKSTKVYLSLYNKKDICCIISCIKCTMCGSIEDKDNMLSCNLYHVREQPPSRDYIYVW